MCHGVCASDVMASVRQMSCHVMLKLPLIVVCAEGSFKYFYLRVFAALSNVSQTYDDFLNIMLIRIHSLLKILEFCSLWSYA